MENNYNYGQPKGSSPGTPRAPMQYFTSGSRNSHNTPPPTGFSSSTPNYPYQSPRMQQPHVRSPYGESPRHASFDSGYQNSFANRSSYSPRYTPSPVRPRNFQQRGHAPTNPYGRSFHSTPNSSYGRGGSFRGRGAGMASHGERAPVERYFKEDMLRDPWAGLQPYLMTNESLAT